MKIDFRFTIYAALCVLFIVFSLNHSPSSSLYEFGAYLMTFIMGFRLCKIIKLGL